MFSLTYQRDAAVQVDSVAVGHEQLDIHQTADRILDLLKVAVFLALAVVLRQSISDGEVETDSVVPGYQQFEDMQPGNARLLDLSTV